MVNPTIAKPPTRRQVLQLGLGGLGLWGLSSLFGCRKTSRLEKVRKARLEYIKNQLKYSKTWKKHGFDITSYGASRKDANINVLIDTNRIKNLKFVHASAKVKSLSEPGIVPNTKNLMFLIPFRHAMDRWQQIKSEKFKMRIEYKDGTVKTKELSWKELGEQ